MISRENARNLVEFILRESPPDTVTDRVLDKVELEMHRGCTHCDRMMRDDYALCCEIARLEHELAIAVKAGHVLSTTRGPFATQLLSADRPRKESQ